MQPHRAEEEGDHGLPVRHELDRGWPHGRHVAPQPRGVQPRRLSVDAAVCQSAADAPDTAQAGPARGRGRPVGARRVHPAQNRPGVLGARTRQLA